MINKSKEFTKNAMQQIAKQKAHTVRDEVKLILMNH